VSLLGIDYASVDSNGAPDVAKAQAAGLRFAYLRKSYYWRARSGACVLAHDAHYDRDAGRLRAAGVKVGAYAFLCYNKGAPSAAEQISSFYHAAGDIRPGVDLPPCVDVEFPGNGVIDTGRTQAECYQFTLEAIDEIRRLLGVWPMVYTSHVEWHDTNGLGGPKDLGRNAAGQRRDCPLWIKIPYRLKARSAVDANTPRDPHYGPNPQDPADLYRVPAPWQDAGWWVRQYQGDALGFPGFSATVDMDDFVGAKLGDRDPRVAWAQRRLGLTDDGAYGPKTDAAVRALQAARGIPAGPEINLGTFIALAWK
jgi:hypothetical protein